MQILMKTNQPQTGKQGMEKAYQWDFPILLCPLDIDKASGKAVWEKKK